MTTDTLDDQGRAAAERLHAATRAADTEAALVRTLGESRSSASRLARARRPLAIAAAIVLVAGGLGIAAWTRGGRDDTGRPVKTAANPADPMSYGPLLGTLRGGTNPTLRADLYGPRELHDGSEVAVRITGGRPGRGYSAQECTVETPEFNPAGNCLGLRGDVKLDGDGNGTLVVPVWQVFTGNGFGTVNDCSVSGCQLLLGPYGADSVTSDPGADENFGEPRDQNATELREPAGSTLPLNFSRTGDVVVPAFAATTVARTAGGLIVRLAGHDLEPGELSVGVDGLSTPRVGRMANRGGEASRSVTRVTVDADGGLDVEVTLPLVIEDTDHDTSIDDVPQPPAVVRCEDAGSSCRILLAATGEPSGRSAHLRPAPAPYPTD